MKETRYNILDYDYPEIADYLLSNSGERKILLTYYNFNTYGLLRNDPTFHTDIANRFTLHVDGVGAYYFSKTIFGRKLKYNINGSNLYPFLVNKIVSDRKKMFVIFPKYSNTKQIENNIYNLFKSNHKLVNFGIFNENSPNELLKKINLFNPYVIFIGIGQPFQELWVSKYKDKINSNLFICSGSGFEFHLSQKKRAPLWFQRHSLEWVYRLFQEPARLWKRYILGIPVFMFHVFVQKAKLLLKID